MKARAKDVLQNYNREIPSDLLADIERVLANLHQIRDNKTDTERYYDSILHADYRFEIQDRDYPFIYNEGEINKNIVKEFRFHLLKLVEHDPSFGYIYYLLGIEQNRHWRSVMYDCVPKESSILFYLKYTWEDYKEVISNLPDTEKLRTLITAKSECQNSNFSIDLKKEFIEKCENKINMIKDLISLSSISPDINNKNNNLSDITNSGHMLFDKSFIDGLKPFSKRLFLCNNIFLVFNKPYECEIEVKILDREIKRTQYLLNKMHKYISKKFPENHDIAVEWLESISNRFGLTVESIKKVGLPKYDKSDSFKNDIDNYFAFIDPE